MDPRLGPRRQKKKPHKAIDFLVNTGTDPLENHKATQQVFRHWRASGTGRKFSYDASCFILANDGLIMLFCASRRLWRVYTFAQAYLSLRHCTKYLGVKTLVSQHICAGVVTGQCNKYRLSLVIVPKYHMLARMAAAGSTLSGFV